MEADLSSQVMGATAIDDDDLAMNVTAQVTNTDTGATLENDVSPPPQETVDVSLDARHMAMATTAMSSSAFFLESAAASLVVRAEVAECLFDLLTDVEMTHYVNTQVAHVSRVRQLEQKLQATQHALDEMSCLYHTYSHARVDLADEVVRDLGRLTEDMLTLERQSHRSQQEAETATAQAAAAEQTAAKAAAAEAEALEAAAAAHAAMVAAAVEAATEKEERDEASIKAAGSEDETKVERWYENAQNETAAEVEQSQVDNEAEGNGAAAVGIAEDLQGQSEEENSNLLASTENQTESSFVTEVPDNEATTTAPPPSTEETAVAGTPDAQPRDDSAGQMGATAEAPPAATGATQANGEADVAAGATAPEDESAEALGAQALPGAEPADAAAGTVTAVEPSVPQQQQQQGGPDDSDNNEEGASTIARAQSGEQPSQTSSGAPTSNTFFFDSNVPYNLETMDEPTLMNIFSYLEAFEILNTAQVNIIMYSRVDSLFRLSGGGEEGADGAEPAAVEIDAVEDNGDDDGDDAVVAVDDDEVDETVSDVAATTTAAAATATAAKKQPPAQKPTPVQVVSMKATTVKMPPVPVAAVIKAAAPAAAAPIARAPAPAPAPAPGAFGGIGSGGLLRSAGLIGGGMRTKSPAPASTSPTPADAATPGAKVQSGLTNMFAMLQNRGKLGNEAAASSTANSTATATANLKTTGEASERSSGGTGAAATAKGSGANSSDSGPEWTPKLADAMSSKLSPAELAVIIAMREGLRQKESELVRLRAQKEDLAAQLQSSEGVKEFLIGKVRDTEMAFKALQKDTTESSKQAASDQEVIAHLDSRVQELEANMRELTDGKEASRRELKQVREVSLKKVRVLSDMLQFEREQLAESEKAWKTTKKLLVKEVKHCRAQILALQAERDSYYQQNLKLRDAVLNSTNNSSNVLNGGGGGGK